MDAASSASSTNADSRGVMRTLPLSKGLAWSGICPANTDDALQSSTNAGATRKTATALICLQTKTTIVSKRFLHQHRHM